MRIKTIKFRPQQVGHFSIQGVHKVPPIFCYYANHQLICRYVQACEIHLKLVIVFFLVF
jgi:hypothetical protein